MKFGSTVNEVWLAEIKALRLFVWSTTTVEVDLVNGCEKTSLEG
jgi:hypothetical protein